MNPPKPPHLALAGVLLLTIPSCELQKGDDQFFEVRPGRDEVLAQRRPEARFPTLPAEHDFDQFMAAVTEARQNAFRQVEEQVDRLYIRPNVQVSDFADRSSGLRTYLTDFIRSSRTVGYEFAPDGIVKVEVEMPLVLLVDKLHEMIDGFYPGQEITHDEVESMLEHYPGRRFISAMGTAKVGEPRRPTTRPTTRPATGPG